MSKPGRRKDPRNFKLINIRIPAKTYTKLRRLSEEEDIPMSSFIRLAISKWLQKT